MTAPQQPPPHPRSRPRTRPRLGALAGVLVLVGLLGAVALGIGIAQRAAQSPGTLDLRAAHPARMATRAAEQTPTASPSAADECPELGPHVVLVRNAVELRAAAATATPGTVIHLADGLYTGQITLSTSGTADAPIVLCGGRDARLRGESISSGYGILLEGDYWHIVGVTIQHFLKGIEAHGTTGSVIRSVAIHDIGQEGIHLRDMSTQNTIEWSVISDTGRHRAEWGEGIYIGSDSRQWCDPPGSSENCITDASDGNVIQFNTLGPGVSAELIDVKEGTQYGTLRGNTLYGGPNHEENVDALVSIKGNHWLIIGNTGSDAPEHGMRVNTDDLDGWGLRNVFIGNTLDVQADGFGFRVPLGSGGVPLDNTVACNNQVLNADEGFANIPCVTDPSPPQAP